jgi:hypothetical protein
MLLHQPFDEFRESVVELNCWSKSEEFARQRNVGKAMPDIAGAIFPGDMWGNFLPPHDTRHTLRDVQDRPALTRSNIEYTPGRPRRFQGQTASARDIPYMHKIAPLQPVFENHWWPAV